MATYSDRVAASATNVGLVTTGTQTLAGLKTLSTGAAFTGGTTLDHYETFSTSFAFRKAGVGASEVSVTVEGVRLGKLVIVRIPGFLISQANPGGIASTTNLATNFRPALAQNKLVPKTIQGTKDADDPANFIITTGGTMQMFSDMTNANFSSGGSPDGLTEAVTFSFQTS
jgi:hypothetical protein